MSKADEMLTECGYYEGFSDYKDTLLFRKGVGDKIIFATRSKVWFSNTIITPKLHQAIHEKMKELGWIDE